MVENLLELERMNILEDLLYSNRGEVEIIEELAVAYNAMDVESFSEYFAEEVEFKSYDGKTYNYKKVIYLKFLSHTSPSIEAYINCSIKNI